MRIGEIATLTGVSTRTIRHYHHVGVLPEPTRESNGYRRYSVRDAVLLFRARRLTELGLSLDEVADVLADDQGRDVREILLELDRDLERQEQEIRARRERIAAVLASSDATTAEEVISPETSAFFAELTAAGATGKAARLDADLMSMLPDDVARSFLHALRAGGDPGAPGRADPGLAELYARLDELADAPADDPRVAGLTDRIVERIVNVLPDDVRSQLADLPQGQDPPLLTAVLDELSPAQEAVFRAMLDRVSRS